MDSETTARTIYRQAHGAAQMLSETWKVAARVQFWNMLMPYGWKLEAVPAAPGSDGVVRCDVKLLGPDA